MRGGTDADCVRLVLCLLLLPARLCMLATADHIFPPHLEQSSLTSLFDGHLDTSLAFSTFALCICCILTTLEFHATPRLHLSANTAQIVSRSLLDELIHSHSRLFPAQHAFDAHQ